MKDRLLRAVAEEGISAVAIDSRNMVEEARRIHMLTPTSSAALGRALTAASMMGAMLKAENGSVTLQFKGNGPLGAVLAVSDSGGNARGYAQFPQTDLPRKKNGKLDVGGAIGPEGRLTVIKDLNMKEPYVGSIELVSGEVGDDVTAYLAQSEQIPSACSVGVLVDTDFTIRRAGGFIIQLLPGCGEDIPRRVEEAVNAAGAVTSMLDGGLDAEGMLRRALSGFELRLLETREVEYRCYCNEDRVISALVSLGRAELEEILRDQGNAEITCQFCDRVYDFSGVRLEELIAALEKQHSRG